MSSCSERIVDIYLGRFEAAAARGGAALCLSVPDPVQDNAFVAIWSAAVLRHMYIFGDRWTGK